MEKVYAEQPAALTRFIDCLAEAANTDRLCIDKGCPADISGCAAEGSKVEQRCKAEATTSLKPAFEKNCVYWDD